MRQGRYYMFHKPAGCVTARRDETHKTVMDYFPLEDRNELFPVGRLDLDTEGLLFFTNDGHFDQALIHPKSQVEKIYRFIATGEVTADHQEALARGVLMKGQTKPTQPAQLSVIQKGTYRDYLDQVTIPHYNKKNELCLARPVFTGELRICEGRKHEVKRLMLYCGCRVVYLKRLAIGGIYLDENLKPGEYRDLTDRELDILYGE